ncbi:hypothetical protein IJT10_02850 [bacterium]|nr:hypothetical protein [bacterium]
MKKSLITLAITSLILSAVSCAPKEEPNLTPPTESYFKLTEQIPQRYDKTRGLALYGDYIIKVHELMPKPSENKDEKDSQQDTLKFFLMLNQKLPNEAILIKAPQALPERVVKEMRSASIVVNGPTKYINCPDLDKYVKDNLGADLAKNSSGALAYIEAEEPFDLNLPEEESQDLPESTQEPTADESQEEK